MLTAGWFVYAFVTGTLIAAAAWAAEGLCRAHHRPTRWSWATAMGVMLGLGLRALLATSRTAAVELPAVLGTRARRLPAVAESAGGWHAVTTALDAISGALATGLARVARLLPPALVSGAAALWLLATVATLLTIALVHLRVARARRGWPLAELHGHDVRIAPALGPAVFGLVQPFIVVPRWLLARTAEEQRLVLAHEAEHVRGRDHLLLAAGWLAAALVPWHPAVWWMLSRLRLAIELDCDARVLRRGVPRRAYGTLLIDLAGHCAGSPVGAIALADESSHLERRLLAMKPTTPRHARARASLLLATGVVALLAACEARLPTSAEVQQADVKAVESSMKNVSFRIDDAQYVIDGKAATADEAHALPNTRIVSMNVTRLDNGRSRIAIITGEGKASGFPMEVHMRHAVATAADSAEMATMHAAHGTEMKRKFDGVLLIDGVQVDNSAMNTLDHSRIASVEVIKGAEAQRQSSDPAAVNGLIRITTKASKK